MIFVSQQAYFLARLAASIHRALPGEQSLLALSRRLATATRMPDNPLTSPSVKQELVGVTLALVKADLDRNRDGKPVIGDPREMLDAIVQPDAPLSCSIRHAFDALDGTFPEVGIATPPEIKSIAMLTMALAASEFRALDPTLDEAWRKAAEGIINMARGKP